MPVDQNNELQEAEIEVLKSIYGDEFQTVETRTAWKSVNAAHEFTVVVHPGEEALKGKVSVRVHFKLPAKYPTTVVPNLALEDARGLSTLHLRELTSKLTNESHVLLSTSPDGQIYDLLTLASSYITDHNSHNGPSTSLSAQREAQQLSSARLEKEARARERERKEREEEEERKRVLGVIEQGRRGRGEVVTVEDETEEGEERDSELKVLIRSGRGKGEEGKVTLGIGAVVDGLGTSVPATITLQSGGPPIPATAHVFDILSSYFLTSQGKRKLTKLTSLLTSLSTLPPSGHLEPLLAFTLRRYSPLLLPSSSSSPHPHDGYTLLILTPTPSTATLSALLHLAGSFNPEKALGVLKNVAEGLGELHGLDVLHKGLRSRSVLLGSAGRKGDDMVRLREFAWYEALRALERSDPWCRHRAGCSTEGELEEDEEYRGEFWTCPEAVEDPFAFGEGRDMWDLGVLFGQMVFGLDVYKRHRTPMDLIRTLPRTTSFRAILTALLSTETSKRPSAVTVLTLIYTALVPSPVSSHTKALTTSSLPSSTSFSRRQGLTAHTYSPPLPHPHHHPSTPPPSSSSGFFYQPRPSGSRYKSEFEELEFLGRGGGGQVVKARNRLDGHLYAVKKIRLPEGRREEEKLLREVTIWSRMNHPNIVRYHTSWVETELLPLSSTNLNGDTDLSTTTFDASTQPPSSVIPSSSSFAPHHPAKSKDVVSHASSSSSSSAEDEDGDRDDDDDEHEGDFDSDSVSDLGAAPLDLDLDLDDLDPSDFLSVGHSLPSIHFGKEGDPDSASEAEEEGKRSPGLQRKGRKELAAVAGGREVGNEGGGGGSRSVRTLYIQMEYVEKLTLKEAIEEGESEVDSWRHMFQILSAMLHFTSLNIIHRDLKPSNIFLDVKGDVRIGDFGLAVNQGLATTEADNNGGQLSLDASVEEADLTSGVGTSLYIAPETLARGRNERSVKYSNKIDMYSLGIVFFELWHPFKTGMERIQVLRELRKPEIIFPRSWDAARLARHTKIVQSCLVHDPERRSSPKDLLNSDLLPPRVGDDSIEETIRLLSHSGTQHAQTLITALFNQSDDDKTRKDFSYDFYDGEGAKVDNDPYGDLVRDKLTRIFRSKGAVCMDSPLLMPQSEIYGARKPVRLLDADGTIACLPFHLNIPFCRMVARDTSLTRLKRWTIAPIYRTAPAGGQPRAVLNAAFDIVTDAHTAAGEAECLYVADEIMNSFPFVGETMHYINHSVILDAVVARVPAGRRNAVLEVLVQHGVARRPWSKTSQELLKIPGVTKTITEEMRSLETPSSLAEVQSRLFAAQSGSRGTALKDGLAELDAILSLSKRLGIRNIKVAPLLATDWDFHKGGVLFETHHVKGKSRSVIMTGGRFDNVVTRLAAPDVRYSGRSPHVVGFSLAVAQLSLAAAEDVNSSKSRNEALRHFGPWTVRRCDVYVVSFVKELVDQRLEVVRDLWKAGIKADLMYDDEFLTLTPDQLVRICRGEGIAYLVFVKDKRIDPENILKVKSVLRGTEEDVSRGELPTWLARQTMIEERANTANGAFDSVAEQPSAHQEPTKPSQEFFPILEDQRHKGKHKQRTMIIQRAQKNVEVAAQAAAEAPVFAIDVEGHAFQLMSRSTAWLHDDEIFRSIVQTAPPAKRDYLKEIRHAILAQRSHRIHPLSSFWLFSLRDDRSHLLTFDD